MKNLITNRVKLIERLFLAGFVLLGFNKNLKAQVQISQCAINMVKGLDTLVSKTIPGNCYFSTIRENRTILTGNCAMAGMCPSALTNTRFVFVDIHVTDPYEFYLSWPFNGNLTGEFSYWGVCIPPPGYFAANPTASQFPDCPATAHNFVDRIRIKKIVGTSLQDENIQNIKSIKNPRLMTPLDGFWPFVTTAAFTNVNNASGVLADITLKDDRTYVGMLWHRYSPEGFGSSFMMNWKEPIVCNASISGLTQTDLGTSPGPCNKIQLSVTVSGANIVTCPDINGTTLIFNHGDGSPPVVYNCVGNTNYTDVYTYVSPGAYTSSVTIYGPGSCMQTLTSIVNITCPPPCIDCIPSFAPQSNKTYVISAWVKEGGAPQATTSYSQPKITINFVPATTPISFSPGGDIIDGWQRIEGQFLIPNLTTDLKLNLDCNSGSNNCFFDDVRVFPVDGSMKSYVYDPVTMRLSAELDERNYATLYEYDEEGKLIRVKKETEKGKMTIKENRNNTKKP